MMNGKSSQEKRSVCRLCNSSEHLLIPLFGEEFTRKRICYKIKETIAIKVLESEKSWACFKCINRLEKFWEFRRTAQELDKNWQKKRNEEPVVSTISNVVHQEPVNGIVQPPVSPDPHTPGRATNQLQYLQNTVMKAVLKSRNAWPFAKPVNAEELCIPDYHYIIKEPMDFGTISMRLERNYYWSAKECIEDFELVFKNCYTYNAETSDVVKMAKVVERIFKNRIKKMPKEELEIGPQVRRARGRGRRNSRKASFSSEDRQSIPDDRQSIPDVSSTDETPMIDQNTDQQVSIHGESENESDDDDCCIIEPEESEKPATLRAMMSFGRNRNPSLFNVKAEPIGIDFPNFTRSEVNGCEASSSSRNIANGMMSNVQNSDYFPVENNQEETSRINSSHQPHMSAVSSSNSSLPSPICRTLVYNNPTNATSAEAAIFKQEVAVGENECALCNLQFESRGMLMEHITEQHNLYIADIPHTKRARLHYETAANCNANQEIEHQSVIQEHTSTSSSCIPVVKKYPENSMSSHSHDLGKIVSNLGVETSSHGFDRPIYNEGSNLPVLLSQGVLYKCAMCRKKTSDRGDMQIHLQKEHTVSNQEDIDNFIEVIRKNGLLCHICMIKFPSNAFLKEHLLEHTRNGTSYSCSICHKIFQSNNELERHILLKHPSQQGTEAWV